jgi:LytTr DNA-binding domain
MILRVKYPDLYIRLIAIPIWGIAYRNIGEVTPIAKLLQEKQYYLDMAVGTFFTWVIWELNRALILRFDKKYSWVEHSLSRALVQGLSCFGLSALIVLMVSFVYNTYVVDRSPYFNIGIVFMTDIPMALMFLLVMHLICTGIWLWEYHLSVVVDLKAKIAGLTASTPEETQANNAPRALLVNQGKAQIPVLLSDIAYLHVAGSLCVVKKIDGQSFSLDQNLEQLEVSMPTEDFFRLNRQVITHRQAIRKVESDGTGRLLLQLSPPFADEVSISRKKAMLFKRWMTGA